MANKKQRHVMPQGHGLSVKSTSDIVQSKTSKNDRAIEEQKLQKRIDRLPAHLREAARRSWQAREEDYRYLAEH